MIKRHPPPDIDVSVLRNYRLNRIREQLKAADCPLAILANPVSLRYATDVREYAMFQSRIPTYYLFVPAEGPVILHGSSQLVADLVDEVRPAHFLNVFDAGLDLQSTADRFAAEVADFLKSIGADSQLVATERLNPSGHKALQQLGIETCDAEPLMEQARLIKSPEEIACIRFAIEVAEYGMAQMQDALQAGITENQLFAILHHTNIAHDGDWIDGRMLNSGFRSNPWFQEASHKPIADGEMVAFDTDMIGPFGYCADVSRTFFCGDGSPTAEQKAVYQRAYDEIQHNIGLIRPGLSFKELSDSGLVQPDEFIPNQYVCLAHGVGMTDEYPKIYYPKNWARDGYDGIIQPNTVMSVESFVGSIHGGSGVKLEEMVLVTENGCELLSSYPFEPRLLTA